MYFSLKGTDHADRICLILWLSKNFSIVSHHSICADHNSIFPCMQGCDILRFLSGKLHHHLIRYRAGNDFLHMARLYLRLNAHLAQKIQTARRSRCKDHARKSVFCCLIHIFTPHPPSECNLWSGIHRSSASSRTAYWRCFSRTEPEC